MEIVSYIKRHDYAAFDLKTIRAMSTAFEGVCKALEISDTAKDARAVIAQRIIGLAADGERDADALRNRVLADATGNGRQSGL